MTEFSTMDWKDQIRKLEVMKPEIINPNFDFQSFRQYVYLENKSGNSLQYKKLPDDNYMIVKLK